MFKAFLIRKEDYTHLFKGIEEEEALVKAGECCLERPQNVAGLEELPARLARGTPASNLLQNV